MKRKDELNIEVLSNIKDEIIDKQSAKRYALMNKKRKPKWIIPSSVAAVLLIAIMIPLFIVLFSKQVPVYEGMPVLSNYQPSTAGIGGATMLSAGGSSGTQFDFLKDDNGNHNGQNKKPVEDIVEDDSSISLTLPDQQMYYAEPNQDIYINIHFSNPDDFVILSFVFNGKTYSSYMFEEGSDMENIIIKCNVGDVEGITEYTIDAIKYVDGTAIKDVIMQGDKTIKVGVYSADKQPTAQIADELIGINGISFTASISDQLDLIKMTEGEVFAILCDDDTIIAQQKLTLGEDNNIKFEGLTKSSTYRYAIIANYDSLDGTGFNTYVLYENEFTTKEVLEFTSVNIEQDSISFSLEWDTDFDNKVLQSLTLYKGEEIIQELDTNATSISGLLSNNEYRLVAAYVNKGETELSDMTFTTKEKAIPKINVIKKFQTQTSLEFDIIILDVDSVGAITKLELIHGEDAQNIADLNTREFTDLLSNNTYTVKVTYTYDLNDGVGNHTIENTVDITTEAKAEPTFTFKNMASELYSISGEYDITNIDNTLISYKVELYRGVELVKENTDKEIAFDSLDYYTDYTVKITYTFDVNDGKGVQTKISEHKIKTLPYLAVNNVSVRNTSAISAGDIIYFQADIDNPCDISITHVVINGKKYPTSNSSTQNRILVDIECDRSLGGEVELVLEKLFLSDGELTSTRELEEKKSAKLIVNGIVELLKIEFVDDKYQPTYWFFPSDTRYIKLTVNNPTGYNITQILANGSTVNEEDIVKISDSEYIVNWGNLDGSDTITGNIYAIFENQYAIKTVTLEDVYTKCVFLNTDEVKYISNAREMVAMLTSQEGGIYYELSCDIDLSNIEWVPIDFYGVLNGNGYSIKNISFTGKSYPIGLGLFNCSNGIVVNVNFKNIFIMTNLSGSNFGMITMHNYGVIDNCTIDSASAINITDAGDVGGLVGYSAGIIINCENHADIVCSKGSKIAGIAGRSDKKIENCANYGNITAKEQKSYSYAAGITGCNGGLIQSCVNHGDISGLEVFGIVGENFGHIVGCTNYGDIGNDTDTRYAAGIVLNNGVIEGCANYGIVTSAEDAAGISIAGSKIYNCINYGDISGKGVGGISLAQSQVYYCANFGDLSGESTGGICAPIYTSLGDSLKIIIDSCLNAGTCTGTWVDPIIMPDHFSPVLTNNYTRVGKTTPESVYRCTVPQFNSKEFYTETLGWSEDVWDFSELDYENGKYPKLK